uniref:Elongation factor 1-beta n=1 Tax=Setaria digitata TaxID=48799 RepID=A0A915PS15_9BILA
MVSVESLLSEVTPLLGCRLALRTAEELFFGDKILHHYHSNDGSTKAISDSTHDPVCRKGKNKDQGNKTRSSRTHEKPMSSDGLRDAIASARKTLKKALEDTDESGADDALGKLTDEVVALKKMSDEMRNEIEKLREDFQKLLQYVQQLKPCISSALEGVGNRILILGDGNLSFSLAFARMHPETEIYASVLENYSEFIRRYPSGKKNISELRSHYPYVHILFSVDACLFPKNWIGFYDDIIWNFPHHCGKANLRKSCHLMRKAFASIGQILSCGRFHITLAKGQSGLDHLSILFKRNFKYRRLPEHRSDSWNIIYIAAEEYFILQEASVFRPELFSSYISSGYHNTERSFHYRIGSETLTFVRTPIVAKIKEFVEYENKIFRIRGVAHEWRPFFQRDLSVVYLNLEKAAELEKILFSLIEELCGNTLVDFFEVMNLRTEYLEQPNRIYRLVWQGWEIPLSKNLCNSLHEEIKLTLNNCFVEQHLEMIDGGIPLSALKKQSSLEIPTSPEASKEDDFDLFGSSDEEDVEKERIKQERLKAYAEKKAKRPETIAKSSIIFDVKPWDDTTNMQEMEKLVRMIEKDGLVWGGAKLIPLAYGIKVLQIISVVEDEKVSVDDLIDEIIQNAADYVQSVDIVAFNKI